MALNFHAVKVVHFILFSPVHLKPLQVVHLFRCTLFLFTIRNNILLGVSTMSGGMVCK